MLKLMHVSGENKIMKDREEERDGQYDCEARTTGKDMYLRAFSVSYLTFLMLSMMLFSMFPLLE